MDAILPEYEKLDLILEFIGTFAFAISGSLVAVRKNMDLMGVVVLGITTAVGGGIVRDMIIGVHPPKTFMNTDSILLSAISSLIIFISCYINKEFINSKTLKKFEKVNAIFDAVGLGAFTVTGINSVIVAGYGKNYALMVFCGILTGVGGGVLRDIFADITPFIFREEVYASASLAGAIFYILTMDLLNNNYVMILSASTVFLIRYYALKKDLSLPKIK